jgi:Flp pilus assembly secretin CpaC
VRAILAACVIASATLTTPMIAQEIPGLSVQPSPSQTITIRMGTSKAIVVEKPYSTIQIVDPTIFDVVPESDRRINLVPKAPGLTMMVIYDKDNARMAATNVMVQRIPETADDKMQETFKGVPGRVKIHNQPGKLAGVAVYSCTPDCDLIKEKQGSFESPEPNPRFETVERQQAYSDPRTGRESRSFERREIRQ